MVDVFIDVRQEIMLPFLLDKPNHFLLELEVKLSIFCLCIKFVELSILLGRGCCNQLNH